MRRSPPELIRFLNTVEREVPEGTVIEAIVHNYATHEHPKVRPRLARHPRCAFHFTPTSGTGLSRKDVAQVGATGRARPAETAWPSER
jgi:hypothetical protein